MIMQTNFKQPPPSFIEEIQRAMRVVVQDADHIVLMGYSLPPDDVAYRAFFAARTRRQSASEPVRCSIVSKEDELGADWLAPDEIDSRSRKGRVPDVVGSARSLFGKDNVRFYGGGVPDVFIHGAGVSDQAVEQLLNWG